MPSGAKKRKQAKKKKEQQAHSNSTNSSSISDTHSQGNDDPKSQDERDSDGGELGSPASQDQHHLFNEENEESKKPVQSAFVSEDNPIDGVEREVENENVVEIQREVNLEQDRSIDVNEEHIEFSKTTHNGEDKSSSSSSSDDESQASDEKQKAESDYSAPEAISCDNVGKAEEVKEDSTIEKQVTKANGNSVMETAPAMDWVTPVAPSSEVAKNASQGSQSENVEVLEVVESEFKEYEDKLLPTSGVVASLVPEENEEKVFPILNQNAGASTTVSTSNVNGNEDKLLEPSSSQTRCAENIKDFEASDNTMIKNQVETLASSVAHTSEANKDIKKAKDFEASENIESQPFVSPAPRIAQRTSVLSCCGLFDVFTGSNG